VVQKRGAQPGNKNAFKHGFYSAALDQVESLNLADALSVESLDQEIALLRAKLLRAIALDPENFSVVIAGTEAIGRLVSRRYRIEGKAEDDLYQAVLGVLEGIGDVLGLDAES
jgi:hypothetical protein